MGFSSICFLWSYMLEKKQLLARVGDFVHSYSSNMEECLPDSRLCTPQRPVNVTQQQIWSSFRPS